MGSMRIHEDRLQSLQPSTPRLFDGQSRDEKGLKSVPESDQRICKRTDVQIVSDKSPFLTLCQKTGQHFLVFRMVLFQYSFQSRVSRRFGENFETKSWVGCGQFQHLVEELSSALDRICLVAKRGVQYLFESLRCRLNHSLEEILFTGEV